MASLFHSVQPFSLSSNDEGPPAQRFAILRIIVPFRIYEYFKKPLELISYTSEQTKTRTRKEISPHHHTRVWSDTFSAEVNVEGFWWRPIMHERLWSMRSWWLYGWGLFDLGKSLKLFQFAQRFCKLSWNFSYQLAQRTRFGNQTSMSNQNGLCWRESCADMTNAAAAKTTLSSGKSH